MRTNKRVIFTIAVAALMLASLGAGAATVNLTLTATTNGTVTADQANGVYNVGQTAVMTAVPASGYHTVWPSAAASDKNVKVTITPGNRNQATIVMNAAETVTVTFSNFNPTPVLPTWGSMSATPGLPMTFCDCFNEIVTNTTIIPLLQSSAPQYLPLFMSLTPPGADINGDSFIDTKPTADRYPYAQYPQYWSGTPPAINSIIIQLNGNGMRDCGAELGVLYKALTDPTVDDTATGGISHAMALAAWNKNYVSIANAIGPTYWNLLPVLQAEGLEYILIGYACIGDGQFSVDPTDADLYHVSGGAGFVGGLLYVLQNIGFLADPYYGDLTNTGNYALLPQYLASTGNASGRHDSDGSACTNAGMYAKFDTAPSTASASAIALGDTAYVNAALDPSQNCFIPCNPTDLTGNNDPDHDGLPTCVEQLIGTDPHNPDSDGGGVFDGVEVSLRMNPLDPSDDHLAPATNHYGLALLGLMIGVAGAVTIVRIRRGRAKA